VGAVRCIDCGTDAEQYREHCSRCGGDLEHVEVLDALSLLKNDFQSMVRKKLEQAIQESRIPYSDQVIKMFEEIARKSML
jgi:predicted amidophosphoribosyltransferase